MEALRTPDDRFGNLAGYDFEPNYLDVPDGEGGQGGWEVRQVVREVEGSTAGHPAETPRGCA